MAIMIQGNAKSLRKLPGQPRPSEILPTDILGGLPQVNRLAKRWLKKAGILETYL